LERVIERFQRINDTIIIEGVHLTPFFMLKVMKQFKRVLPFALCINKESKHKERFAVRSKYMTLDPGNNKYIENFPRIRLI
jgi:2-phosphoglycerate kinase